MFKVGTTASIKHSAVLTPLVPIGGGVILRAAVINTGDNHLDDGRVGKERGRK